MATVGLFHLAALSLAACGLSGQATPVAITSFPPIDIVGWSGEVHLFDRTGLVTGVIEDAIAPPDLPQQGAASGVQDGTVWISWLGGACSKQVDVVFDFGDGGIVVTIDEKKPPDCSILMGVDRRILVSTRSDIPPDRVSVRVG